MEEMRKGVSPNNSNTGSSREVVEFLEKQSERVDKWLHFAEAKNALVLTFLLVILVDEKNFMLKFFDLYLNRVLFIPLFLTLYSFIPNLKSKKDKSEKKSKKKVCEKKKCKKNLLFFGDLKDMDNESEYIEEVLKEYFDGRTLEEGDKKIAEDLAKEIIVNSEITSKKFDIFKLNIKLIFCYFILYLGLELFTNTKLFDCLSQKL